VLSAVHVPGSPAADAIVTIDTTTVIVTDVWFILSIRLDQFAFLPGSAGGVPGDYTQRPSSMRGLCQRALIVVRQPRVRIAARPYLATSARQIPFLRVALRHSGTEPADWSIRPTGDSRLLLLVVVACAVN